MKSVSTILLAAFAGVDRSVLALELEGSPNLPQVPQVENPDQNGFPTIRSVQSVMEGYAKEKDRLNHEAAALGLHLKKVEKEDADRIVQQNAVFLQKLREQEQKNQVVSVENSKVAEMILKVRKGNEKLTALVQKEQKVIQLRRSQFSALKQKFLEGQERVKKLLEGSDTSKELAEEASRAEDRSPMSFLEIVQEGARRKRLQEQADELEIEASPAESAETPASEIEAATEASSQTLLAEQSATSSQISNLAKQASKLSQATQHSLAELKKSFQEAYKAGARRHNALVDQQKVLKAELQSVEKQFAKLKADYKRANALRAGLEQELKSNGALLGKVQQQMTAL
eukprot:TRINITY_DN30229_c0_g1_i1.p1 TRINITY_DN30229_c0_g1~~TRINITY_DN30229_c0_g1_i1.p1  ORF type:complete len:343 (+),score=101.61 TRINITY_DN30229_c0_g1_i1:71-1099(+)